jgi:hypothetical protein
MLPPARINAASEIALNVSIRLLNTLPDVVQPPREGKTGQRGKTKQIQGFKDIADAQSSPQSLFSAPGLLGFEPLRAAP